MNTLVSNKKHVRKTLLFSAASNGGVSTYLVLGRESTRCNSTGVVSVIKFVIIDAIFVVGGGVATTIARTSRANRCTRNRFLKDYE